ncbi:hypothetical protein POK33_12830 [Burkholderia cenocepacia]|uniref:hypothetical protein n=1 Tax=Burkholderia cenocepacia TaxID=95486 RepID=UPI0023B9BFD7|nr:hypothetical protein [Burkholderia cenocepacia]MDF0501603.1 hypothetical protein [Burkholderia cenocepacia]
MKHRGTLHAAIKYGAVALLSFGVGRLSTYLVGSLFAWPRTPDWMDVDATGVVVNGTVAFGTFTAAFVAIWAALSERRTRMRNDRVIAQLTAAGISTRLDIAADVVSNISEALETAIETETLTSETAINMREGIESIPLCTFEEIKCLAPLREHCAALIAAAQDRLHVAAGALNVLSTSGISPGQRMINEGQGTQALKQSATLFKRAKSICDSESAAIQAVLGSAESPIR